MNTKSQVLVIDDDAVVGRSFDRVLTGKGYEVSTALSGEEALETLNKTEFDVVFTDIKMPGMDGLEVAARIRERCPWTPVVVITGYGSADDEARAAVLGVSGFVHKPLSPEIIESITLKAVSEGQAQTAPQVDAKMDVEVEVANKVKAGLARKVLVFGKAPAMFLVAPFIALGYVIALPFIGFYQFAKLAYEAFAKTHPQAAAKVKKAGVRAKNVGLFFASPFIALGYVIALPIVGFYMFTKLGYEAHAKR